MAHQSDSTDSAVTDNEPITQPILADWRDYDSLSTAIVEAVAAATDREPTDLPPLYESIDTDALDAIAAGWTANTDRRDYVSFAFAGVDVAVESDGGIEVRPDGAEPHRRGGAPRTESELSSSLQRLLNAASRNGISIEGGWAVQNGPELPDWDIHITRVERPE